MRDTVRRKYKIGGRRKKIGGRTGSFPKRHKRRRRCTSAATELMIIATLVTQIYAIEPNCSKLLTLSEMLQKVSECELLSQTSKISSREEEGMDESESEVKNRIDNILK